MQTRLTCCLIMGALWCLSAGSALAVSQTTLPGYKSIRFGEPKHLVMNKLRSYFKYEATLSSGTPMYFGTIVGYRQTRVFANFQQNILVNLRFAFSSQQGMSSLDVFEDLQNKLKSNYGEPSEDKYQYYDASDANQDLSGDEGPTYAQLRQDVLNGKATLWTIWNFPADGNQVVLQIHKMDDGTMFTSIDYNSPRLYRKLEDKATIEDL